VVAGEGDSRRPAEATIDVAIESPAWRRPGLAALVRRAARAALADNRWYDEGVDFGAARLAVALVTDARVATLNERYRGRSGPTNVLSFPAFAVAEMGAAFRAPRRVPLWLGDIAVADGVTAAEAAAAGRPLEHHLAHLVVHGTLHCLGHDHVEDAAAVEMEARERRILARLGVPDPYRDARKEAVGG